MLIPGWTLKTFKQGCEKPVYGNRPYTGFFGDMQGNCAQSVEKLLINDWTCAKLLNFFPDRLWVLWINLLIIVDFVEKRFGKQEINIPPVHKSVHGARCQNKNLCRKFPHRSKHYSASSAHSSISASSSNFRCSSSSVSSRILIWS